MANIFRSEALKKLRDPAQLDTALTLTSPAGWMALATIGVILLSALVWGFAGRVSYRADGMGVVLRTGGTIYPMLAPTEGFVSQVHVHTGQTVRKGDPLVTLSLPDREVREADAMAALERARAELGRQSSFTQGDVSDRQRLVEQQIAALRQNIAADRERRAYLAQLLEIEKQELDRGYITREKLEATRSELYSAEQSARENENRIADLRTQQLEFQNQQRRDLSSLRDRVAQAEATLREIRTTIETDKVITAPVDGTIAEIPAKKGVRVTPQMQLAVVEQSGSGLQVQAYLPVSKGKRVSKGMNAEISPTSVEREIYGSIKGRVLRVSPFPVSRAELMATIGNEELVGEMLKAGAPIEATIELEADPATVSGLKWSSSIGPPLRVTPGTMALTSIIVRRQRPVDLIVPIYETWIGGK
jgi:HlyD family secretion protein